MNNETKIPGFECYTVDTLGIIRSYKNIKCPISLKITKNSGGYAQVNLCLHGICTLKTVHRLVLLTFKGCRPEGLVIDHINGIKTDNRLANLEYVTQSENLRRAYLNGSASQKGESNNSGKLTEKEVLKIRELYTTKQFNRQELALIFDVHPTHITRINKFRSWRHI